MLVQKKAIKSITQIKLVIVHMPTYL